MLKLFGRSPFVLFLILGFSQPGYSQNPVKTELFTPFMALQFESRQQARNIYNIADYLAGQSENALKTPTRTFPGLTGVKVTGDTGNSASWKYQGLAGHLEMMQKKFIVFLSRISETEKLTEVQIVAFQNWQMRLGESVRAFNRSSTIENLDTVSETIYDIYIPFQTIDRPEVNLLEASLEATVRVQRIDIVGGYFESVLQAHAEKTEGWEKQKLEFDGITINPMALLANPQAAGLTGLKAKHDAWLGRTVYRLQPLVGENPAVLKTEMPRVRSILDTIKKLRAGLDQGNWSLLQQISDVADQVRELYNFEDSLAPVALASEAKVMTDEHRKFFASLNQTIIVERDNHADVLEGRRNEMQFHVELKNPATLKFTAGAENFAKQISLVRRLGETTLKVAKLSEPDRKQLIEIVEALKSCEKAMAETTPVDSWTTWTKTIQGISSLYRR